MSDIKGLYNGAFDHLRFKTALLKKVDDGWLAQFDDIQLGYLAHGWHPFAKEDFVNVIDYGNPDDPNAYKPSDMYRGPYASEI
jgi:hypothetical protein